MLSKFVFNVSHFQLGIKNKLWNNLTFKVQTEILNRYEEHYEWGNQ